MTTISGKSTSHVSVPALNAQKPKPAVAEGRAPAAVDEFLPLQPGMTALTGRMFREAGISQQDAAAVFAVTNDLTPVMSNIVQSVEVPEATFPQWNFKAVSEMRVTVPLAALDVRPMTHDEFLEQLEHGRVQLPQPWHEGQAVATFEVRRQEGALRGGPQLEFSFPDVNLNIVGQVAPKVSITLPSGQLIILEVKPQRLVASTREAEIASALQQVPEVEAQIAKLEAERGHPSNIAALREFVARQRAQAAELARKPFVGSEALPAFVRR